MGKRIVFFTSTLWKDEDNYRFMEKVANYIGIVSKMVDNGQLGVFDVIIVIGLGLPRFYKNYITILESGVNQ
jgi:hypothetical protein